jgi:signal peptidase II
MGRLVQASIAFGAIVANLGLDRLSKEIAIANLKGQGGIRVLGDFFILTYAENEGAFLGMGGSWPPALRSIFLIWLPLAATIAALVWVFATRKLSRLELILVASAIGGGIGNLADRIIQGYVVDFMNFGIGSLRTGVLNVADLSLTFGLAAFLIAQFVKESKAKKASIAALKTPPSKE